MTNITNPRVAMYVRTPANDIQNEVGTQKTDLLEYCNEHNLSVNEHTYIDVKNPENKSVWNKLLRAIKQSRYLSLLTYRLHRIFGGANIK